MALPPLPDVTRLVPGALDGRPDFLVRLGLLLPCSVEDVEAAFRNRAMEAHPDHGGSVADFVQLEADRKAALEYARFFSSRRAWLAANVERYAAQQDFIAKIERLGGSVETERPEWIANEIGEDFAQIVDTIIGVRLTGQDIGHADVQLLIEHQHLLGSLHRLDLSDSRVEHSAVKRLAVLPTLHELDLHGSYAGNRTARVLAEMPALRRVNLADTFVTWRGVWNLRRRRPNLQILTSCAGDPARAPTKRGYVWTWRVLVLYSVALVLATHVPEEPRILREVYWQGADKIAHFGVYCGLAFLTALLVSWRNIDRTCRTGLAAIHYAAIAFFIAIFAAVDELTQPWTGRDRDLHDWFADVVGLSVGLLLFAGIMSWRRRAVRGQSFGRSGSAAPATDRQKVTHFNR